MEQELECPCGAVIQYTFGIRIDFIGRLFHAREVYASYETKGTGILTSASRVGSKFIVHCENCHSDHIVTVNYPIPEVSASLVWPFLYWLCEKVSLNRPLPFLFERMRGVK
jgi:hypothetical protein